MSNNNIKSSLLDELDSEKKFEDKKEQTESKQINRIMPLIEKMIALKKEFQKLGQLVDYIKLTDYDYTSTWFIKNGFTFIGLVEYKGKIDNYTIKDYVKNYLEKRDKRDPFQSWDMLRLKVFNAEVRNIIIFDIGIDKIEMHCHKICAAEGRAGKKAILRRDEPFMVKKFKYQINPDGFTDDDIDNCFKFLLSINNYLSLPSQAVGSSSGGCFIATAVYESYNAPEVLIFRTFRDEVLDKYILGRIFIKTYYFVGPKIINVIKNKYFIKHFLKTRFFSPILNIIR